MIAHLILLHSFHEIGTFMTFLSVQLESGTNGTEQAQSFHINLALHGRGMSVYIKSLQINQLAKLC